MNEYSGIDFNSEWAYPLQWLYESEVARRQYLCKIHQVQLAMQGLPFKNLYEEEVTSIVNGFDPTMDANKRAALEKKCLPVPPGLSFALKKAVQNRAAQTASGVDTYEYRVEDPYMIINDETEDLLAAKCEQDYISNRLGLLATTMSNDLTKYGLFACIVNYCPISDKNTVKRIHPKNVIWDTKYSTTGQERFRGYNMMISWAKLKKMIADDPNEEVNLDIKAPDRTIISGEGKDISVDKQAKYSNKKIRSLNGLDIYVQDINKLAESSQLQGWTSTFPEYSHDLYGCYNLGWYHTLATDPRKKTESGYNGDDVELTIMYDLDRKIEFKIINRRYVISANSKAFKRQIDFKVENPITGEIMHHLDEFHLDCPLKFVYEEQDCKDVAPYPTCALFDVLPLHDQLCSWRAKRDHVAKLLAILRIETNGADADSLKGLLNIMGIVLDDIQGDIGTIQFQYDFTAIDTQIQYLENEIKTVLSAYDQFDAMQMMGDRATAAEAGQAQGAVAQGLAPHQNAMMQAYADIARQMIANRVAYSTNHEFPVTNRGEYGSITIQEMALTATVNVKSKMAAQVHERIAASNALQILGTMRDILNDNGLAYFAEKALFGEAPRKMIATFIAPAQPDPAAVQAAQMNGQNMANQIAQNQQMYNENPTKYETENVLENASPEELDEVINRINGAIEPPMQDVPGLGEGPRGLDMPSQEGSYVSDTEGMTPYSGGDTANINSLL